MTSRCASNLALATVVVCAACTSIELEALHAPPVGGTAIVDADDRTIELSAGTALAIECAVAPTFEPCTGAETTIVGEGIASTRRLHVDNLYLSYGGTEGLPRSGFVLIGHAEGEAELEVATNEGDVAYQIRIVE